MHFGSFLFAHKIQSDRRNQIFDDEYKSVKMFHQRKLEYAHLLETQMFQHTIFDSG